MSKPASWPKDAGSTWRDPAIRNLQSGTFRNLLAAIACALLDVADAIREQS